MKMDKVTQNITSWVEESEDLECLYDTDDSADDPDFVQPDIQEQCESGLIFLIQNLSQINH